jgi:hypothetical protein
MAKHCNPKTKTRDQVKAMQEKAVRFLRDVVGDDDKADEIDGMSVEEYAVKKKVTIENPRRKSKNPSREVDKAADLYDEFHGEAPQEVIDVQESELARDTYSAHGGLYQMKLRRNGARFTLDFSDCGAVLARSVEGHQLYIVGGDQDCSPILSNGESKKDFINLGTIERISYVTRKGFDKFKESAYEHKFGEEGGEPPILMYARLKRRMFIVGGDYTIGKPGIMN